MRRPHLVVSVVAVVLTACSGGTTVSTTGTDPGQSTSVTTSVPATTLVTATTTTLAPTTTTTAPTTTTQSPLIFETIILEGSGDDVVDIEVPGDVPALVTFSHNGVSNFAVWSHDDGGDALDLLVNTIGDYEGTRPINLFDGAEVAFFEVSADGPWTIRVESLHNGHQFLGGAASGSGDDVLVDFDAPQGAVRATLTHAGSSNFAIWVHGDETDLLVNEIGAYSGTVLVPGGTVIWDVTADGEWTITIDG